MRPDIPSRLKRIIITIIVIILVGTVGYKLVGAQKTSWLDALYMTAITITTVATRTPSERAAPRRERSLPSHTFS